MKIFEYIKEENERIAKVLGFTILKQTSDYMTSNRYQSFCGGIVTTERSLDPYTWNTKKDIRIFGQSIIRRYEENNYRTYYFLNKPIKKYSLIEEFKEKYFKYFDKDHDDIYILRANSGEIYLILTYLINQLIKRNNSKNPLLVATQEYHVDMIKLICPNIPYVYIDNLQIKTADDTFIIDNFRFFYLFSSVHFKQVELDIKTQEIGKCHYFKSILTRLNISENDISMNKIIVNPQDEQNCLNKIKNIGLNVDNFVFLAPEAKSCKLYDEDFWCELIKRYQQKGLDVFVNIVDDEIKLSNATNYKSEYLTYTEAFILAKHSKRIVSLRSGFTEFLLQTDRPIDVLYTKFRNRHFFDELDATHILSGFSLMELPFINKANIREFNMFEISQKECLEKILNL